MNIIRIFLLTILISILLLIALGNLDSRRVKTLNDYASLMIANCEKANHPPSCYDREIPKLMDQISMEEAFETARIVKNRDPEYQYCHVLGHRLSSREVNKDPSKWKEVFNRCETGQCSNGCIHGVLQEKFKEEVMTDTQIDNFINDLKDLCLPNSSWNPTAIEKNGCYHGVGHLLMYISDAEIQKSTDLCNAVTADKDSRQFCYDGIFMQLFQPLEPEDIALIKNKQPKAEDVEKFCGNYSSFIKASCLSESWPLFKEEVFDPDKVYSFCLKEEAEHQVRCLRIIFSVVASVSNLDSKWLIDYCSRVHKRITKLCFSNVAVRMIGVDYSNINKAVNVCKAIKEKEVSEFCFEEILFFSGYIFHNDSEQYREVCNALLDPWKSRCLSS